MKTYQHNQFSIRLLNQRPKAEAIQVNIYSPDDAGYSYCAFVSVEDFYGDFDALFENLVNSGVLGMMEEKAQVAFSNHSNQAMVGSSSVEDEAKDVLENK
jgi:hypothetical protein